MQDATDAALEQARDAAASGDWADAYERLIAADATTPLTGPDLALLAGSGYAAGHLDVTIETWERVHRASVQAGDRMAAAGAAVRVAMHLLFDTALLAPVRGWLTRAERLLDGVQDDTPVDAWLAVVRNYERLLSGDFAGARQWARRAIEAGTGSRARCRGDWQDRRGTQSDPAGRRFARPRAAQRSRSSCCHR